MAVFLGGVVLLLLLRIRDRFRALAWCRRALFSYSACLLATLGDSTVPIGSRTYSFRGLALISMLVMYFLYVLPILYVLILIMLSVLLTLMSRCTLMLRLRITAWF